MGDHEVIPMRPSSNEWKALFEQVDQDGDGTISYHELTDMIKQNPQISTTIRPHVIRMVHQKADKNGDGTIDYYEFVRMMENPENRPLFSHYLENLSKEYIRYLIPKPSKEVTEIDGQYEDEYTCCPPPLGMIFISLAEIILFIIDESQASGYANGPIASALMLDPTKREEAWRFITYMFVHVGYTHLIVNLAVQLLLGIPLEMVHRWYRVLGIYLAGVVAGSLATTVFDPTVKLAGASGGVYSLITAHIATIVMNWSEMAMPAVQLIIFLIITVIDTGTAIYNRYFLDLNDHIGYVAHFAGATAGLLVGILILRNLEVKKGERICRWISLAVYLILMGTGIFINIFWTDHFERTPV